MAVTHAGAQELLERYGRAWEAFDGDAWTELFRDDVEYHEDPFEPPMVGRNAVRAYLLEASRAQEQVEFTVERHWAVEDTVLAAWHASYVRRQTKERVRLSGFLTLEIADGRIRRLREWWHRRPARTTSEARGG
jgi:ketosteroid isomerase-like protein